MRTRAPSSKQLNPSCDLSLRAWAYVAEWLFDAFAKPTRTPKG